MRTILPALSIRPRSRRLLLVGVSALAVLQSCRSSSTPVAGASAAATEPPRLVVLLVVDQLREPLLDRYNSLFKGGFRRLIDEGVFYTNATHNHAATKTAPGHATISTGVYPSRHGVVANEWYEQSGGKWIPISNVGDSTVKIVGFPILPGVSPHSLMREGLADWMKHAHSTSIVASISPKDRGAVLPAAHVKGDVYWFEPLQGRFVTSTYYRDRYPDWVNTFQARTLPRFERDSVWESRIPPGALSRSTPDTMANEGDGKHTFFPHTFAAEAVPGTFWQWFERTPMLDELVLLFADQAVISLGMGRDSIPDFLNVSVSQTDRIGHDYGPHSREELDNLLRLDRELGVFFASLDRQVGRGRWVLALTADHGSLPNAEELPTVELPFRGRRITPEEKARMDTIRAVADRSAQDPTTPARTLAAVKALDFVVDAWTTTTLRTQPPADSFATLFVRSMYPGRAGEDFSRQGVEVRYMMGWMDRARGTGHGLPYWYDRHVPIIVLGSGAPHRRDSTNVSTMDIAPSLARMAGVPYPSDLDGKLLPGLRR